MNPSPAPEIAPKQPLPRVNNTNKRVSTPFIVVILLLSLSLAFLFYQNYRLRQQLTSISQSSLSLPQPSPTPDSTAGWKTYTGDKYQLKYPSDWYSRTTDFGVTISSYLEGMQPEPEIGVLPVPDIRAKIEIYIKENPRRLSPNEWYLEQTKNRQDPDTSVEAQSIKIDGINAYMRVDNSLSELDTIIYGLYLPKDDKIYQFWAGGNKSYEQKLFQILSTFRFIDTTNDITLNWQTYNNSTNGYSFRYPDDWFLTLPPPGPTLTYAIFASSYNLSNYDMNKIERYMDHGFVNWQTFIGDKPAFKVDIYIDTQTNITKTSTKQSLNKLTKIPSIASIGNLPTTTYEGAPGPDSNAQSYLLVAESDRLYISLGVNIYNATVQSFFMHPDWKKFKQILSTFETTR